MYCERKIVKLLKPHTMKYRKIPLENLGMAAYLLLQVTNGIFKWNGELFFCPFITLEDKKNPLRVGTWTNEFKDKKYTLDFIDHNILWLFADPVDPITYTKTKQRVMDRSLGINSESIFLVKDKKIVIKRKGRIDVLEFVKNISDKERKNIFDPNDSMECKLRTGIWMTSKEGNSSFEFGSSSSSSFPS